MITLGHLTLTAIAIILTSHLPLVPTTTTNSSGPPQAHTLNGTYTGLHLPFFSQDLFLGIPYAQSTADTNRFRPPQSLNTSWSGSHSATTYSPACPDHAPPSPIDNDTLHGMSEDCLSINIVRPSGEQKPLPVVLWIHGGSYQFGTSGLPRYNLSFIVQRSVEMGKPILAASINYRKSSWGLLFSQEIMGSGNTNLALRDMIKALEWVQENIAGFGGDPGRVTIWGESSGSFAVGQLVVAYGGRLGGPASAPGKGDGKGKEKGKGKGTGKPLFHATIQESGSATTAWYNGTERYQPIYDLLVQRANCSEAIDTLACLRTIPYPDLYPLMSPYTLITDGGPGFYPIIDGDLLPAFPSFLLAQGRFASDIPHLLGTNSDEGTDNAPRWGISTDEQIFALVRNQSGFNFPESTVQQILDLYPDDPAKGIPLDTGNTTFQETSKRGKQYKRAAAILGDVFYHSPRLFDARHYSFYHGSSPNSTFVYRFNTRPWLSQVNLQYQGLLAATNEVNVTCEPQAAGSFGKGETRCGALAPAADGVTHATELAFVFQHPEFLGPWKGYWGLSDVMTEFWLNFVSDGTPNGDQNRDRKEVVVWPAYGSGDGEEGVDLVLQTEEQGGLVVERDTWRLEGRELLGRWARRRNV